MSVPTPYTRALSVEDFAKLDTPENELLELARGCVVREPLPAARHGIICATIALELGLYAKHTGAGRVLGNDTGFVLSRDPATVRGPDVAFVRSERCAQVDGWSTWIEGPPDLAVEVLSPSNRKHQIHDKVGDYQRAGTSVIWLIDPDAQCIKVYEGAAAQTLTMTDDLMCKHVLPGSSIPVAHVFQLKPTEPHPPEPRA